MTFARKSCSRLATTKESSKFYFLHIHTTSPPSLHTVNPFAALKVEEPPPVQPQRRLEELAEPVAHTNKTPERKLQKKQTPTSAPTQAEGLSERREPPTCAAQDLAWPHKSSYFLPGKAAGPTMLYLVNTG